MTILRFDRDLIDFLIRTRPSHVDPARFGPLNDVLIGELRPIIEVEASDQKRNLTSFTLRRRQHVLMRDIAHGEG